MVDLTRRTVLRGFAGLAAVAVAPGAVLSADDSAALVREMKTGLIEDRVFYLDRLVVIENLKDLVIRRCHFICTRVPEDEVFIEFSDSCERVTIEHCVFSFDLWLDPSRVVFEGESRNFVMNVASP